MLIDMDLEEEIDYVKKSYNSPVFHPTFKTAIKRYFINFINFKGMASISELTKIILFPIISFILIIVFIFINVYFNLSGSCGDNYLSLKEDVECIEENPLFVLINFLIFINALIIFPIFSLIVRIFNYHKFKN